jgi:hypothetical protein
LQAPAHAASSLADFSILKIEAIRSPETSVHTRSTWRHIPEDGIFIVTAVKTSNLTQCFFISHHVLMFPSLNNCDTVSAFTSESGAYDFSHISNAEIRRTLSHVDGHKKNDRLQLTAKLIHALNCDKTAPSQQKKTPPHVNVKQTRPDMAKLWIESRMRLFRTFSAVRREK